MTVSNFSWTDKTSVRWFIFLPTGHEGPYSLESLQSRSLKGNLSPFIKIWAEGLEKPLTLKEVIALHEEPVALPEFKLPPLPEDEVITLPLDTVDKQKQKNKSVLLISLSLSAMVFIGLYQWISGQEHFKIRRYPKMSLDLHQRILGEFTFEGWNKKIFFKEYVPTDLSSIWLVTSGYQSCEVEADFNSIKDKLISLRDESVSFKTRGNLSGHVVEFSKFSFTDGTRVIPGMYEMDIHAKNCRWDSILPSLANIFSPPDSQYVARTRVILFDQGPVAFNKLLESLLRKKIEEEAKVQNLEESFWTGLQEKLLTLNAIVLRVEQHFLDTLTQTPQSFDKKLKPSIETYTNYYGSFLSSFVIKNEEEFKQLLGSELKGISQKRNYELMLKMTAKKIGLESMTIIEEMQTMKSPKPAQLTVFEAKIKKNFAALKEEINQKLIQISEDRSK